MKIKKVTYQNRRDFKAIYQCENCGATSKEEWGYNDGHFHDNVIPEMKCKHCSKSRKELNAGEEYTFTKYPVGMQL